MDFQAKSTSLLTSRTGCLVIPASDDGKFSGELAELDSAGGGFLTTLVSRKEITGKHGSTLSVLTTSGIKAERVLVVGTGKANTPMSADQFDTLAGKLAAAVKSMTTKDVTLALDSVEVTDRDEDWKARQIAKAFVDQFYAFAELKSDKPQPVSLKKVIYLVSGRGEATSVNKALKTGAAIGAGMSTAKDLGNLPGNVCTPKYLSKEARKLGRASEKLSVKILGEKQMQELGMGSLLSVSAGSDEEAQLISMEYMGGKKSEKPIVLVGKGITFDSGGISLKPGAGMDEMKFDMCGAASVFGVMKTVTQLELPINVVGLVAASENLPSGRATKPGDIVTSMSGQTIEILNTDAEGRLVLCDALTYADRYNPETVVDMATLTGACMVALGKVATGLFSNDDELAEELLEAGRKAGDKAWRLPVWDEYQPLLNSNFADMANIGGPHGGAITAACFLSRFTKGYRWAHLDIAGTAWLSGGAKGATGRPVSLLVEYLMSKVK